MSIVTQLGWKGLALVASLLFNVAFVVTALLPCCPSHEHPAPAVQTTRADSDTSLLAGIELSDEQNGLVNQRRIETANQIGELRQKVSQARGRMWLLVAVSPLDRQALAHELDIICSAQRTIQELVVEYMAWIREQLSGSQVALFDSAVLQRTCRCPGCDGGCVQGCPSGCRHGSLQGEAGVLDGNIPEGRTCGHGGEDHTCGH